MQLSKQSLIKNAPPASLFEVNTPDLSKKQLDEVFTIIQEELNLFNLNALSNLLKNITDFISSSRTLAEKRRTFNDVSSLAIDEYSDTFFSYREKVQEWIESYPDNVSDVNWTDFVKRVKFDLEVLRELFIKVNVLLQ